MYISVEKLKDNVVLDPTWLIDALKSLINAGGDNDNTQEMLDLKEKGIINPKVVETIWTKELPAHKSHALMLMEQLNIIAKVRVFDVMGVIEKDFFLAPCMLRQEVPAEVISPEQDASVVTTPEMRCIFTGKYLPIPIFHRLLAACIDHWPVAKKEKSEHLIFCGCCVFDLDLFHRLTVYIKSHTVYAKVTRKVIDVAMPPDAGLCSHARRFISVNLTKITSYLGQNLQYELDAPDSPWHEDCNSDATLTPEHMNHQRLTVALVTVGGNAMREILCVCLPPNTDLRRVILANKTKLMTGPGKLERDQINLVFPDAQTVGKVIQFDISLLYKLIRNISTVPPHSSGWGHEPQNSPRDKSLGASVERIRLYRNEIAHSKDGKVSNQDFDDYWGKFESVVDDIEDVLGNQGYKTQLKKLKTQVISVYESS